MLTKDERPPSTTKPLRLAWSHLHCAQAQVFVIRPWSFVSRVTATLYDV
jgi:hypothetical protein